MTKIIIVGNLGRVIGRDERTRAAFTPVDRRIGGTDRTTPKEKAARVVAHPGAEAPYKRKSNHRPAGTPSFSMSFTTEAFEQAFPGQSVRNGVAINMRPGMRFAQGLTRAAARDDMGVAFVYLRAMLRATAPLSEPKQ